MKSRLAIFLTVVLMLVVLAALNAASYVRVEQEADSEFAPDRSTQNSGATGTRAFYEFLGQSGYKVVRWGQPLSSLSGHDEALPGTFVMVGRLRRPVENDEAEALLRWVAEGGRLVIIDRRPDTKLLPTSGGWHVASEIFDYPRPDARPDNTESMTNGVPPIAPAQPTLLTRDVSQVTRSRYAGRIHIFPVGEKHATGVGQSQPPPVKSGPVDPEKAETGDDSPDSDDDEPPPPPPPKPVPNARGPVVAVSHAVPKPVGSTAPVRHLADGREGEGSLLVDYVYGRGRIVLLSDPYIVSNGGINLADNLILVTNIVAGAGHTTTTTTTIAFDEYHQGYGATEHQLLAYFAGTPILWMFAQVALIVLAVLWTRGRRFARPLPSPHVDRRSKLEFVASMAELQSRARAYDLAIENVYSRTRRALARYGGTSASAPFTEIAARVAARSGKDAREIETLLRDCEDATAGAPTTARKALALVKQLRELERDLGIRMRSREIRQAETR